MHAFLYFVLQLASEVTFEMAISSPKGCWGGFASFCVARRHWLLADVVVIFCD